MAKIPSFSPVFELSRYVYVDLDQLISKKIYLVSKCVWYWRELGPYKVMGTYQGGYKPPIYVRPTSARGV